MDNRSREDQFYLKVAQALSGCQLVEEELKLYITQALQLARKCIGDKMPFHMSGRDYENASLERLIEVFKKSTENDQLVKELGKFKEERNFLSHQGISHCLDFMGDLHYTRAGEVEIRLHNVQSEAVRLREAIHSEAGKFLGHLWFDHKDD